MTKFKKAFSAVELLFIIFILFFVYTFVIKQMIADMKFSDLKRFAGTSYSKLNTAFKLINPQTDYSGIFENEYTVINLLTRNMQVEKVCRDAKAEGCWSTNWLWTEVDKPGILTSENEFILAEITSTDCSSNLNIPNTCGTLYVDTNALKAPNKIGQDIIKIYITKNGLVPAGVKEDVINPPSQCDFTKKFTWSCSAKLCGTK